MTPDADRAPDEHSTPDDCPWWYDYCRCQERHETEIADRARAEVQAAVRSVLDNATLVRGHRSGRTLEQEFRTAVDAALSDTAALDRMLAEARAEALRDAADAWTQGAWADTPRRADRVADRMAASQYAGDWLRERARQVRAEGEGAT